MRADDAVRFYVVHEPAEPRVVHLQTFDEIDMDKRDMPRLGDLGSGMGNVD